VTSIHGGENHNVIPDTVELKGTARSLTPAVRATAQEAVTAIAQGVAQAAGATAEVDYELGYEAAFNDPEVAAVVRRAGSEVRGADAVVEMAPLMAGDDFSAYSRLRPGTYFFVGTADDGPNAGYGLHHARFTPNEGALEVGVSCMAHAALSLLRTTGHETRV